MTVKAKSTKRPTVQPKRARRKRASAKQTAAMLKRACGALAERQLVLAYCQLRVKHARKALGNTKAWVRALEKRAIRASAK